MPVMRLCQKIRSSGLAAILSLVAAGCATDPEATPRLLVASADPSGTMSCQNPTFSPDGRFLLFTRFTHGYNEGPSQLVALDLRTAVERVIMDGVRLDADCVSLPGPSWIGDEICFASDANLQPRTEGVWVEELYVVSSDGGSLERLTYHGAGDGSCIEPLFNPADPRRLLFTWEPRDEEAASRIGFLERGRGNRITLVGGDPDLTTRIPNWSHDGRRIAFHRWDLRDPDAMAQVFVADVVFPDDGSPPRLERERRLEQRHADNTDVSWYVNDRYVLSASADDDGVNVWAIPVDGGAAVQLTHHRGASETVAAPCCSPDGRSLVYELGEPARLMIIDLPWRKLGLAER